MILSFVGKTIEAPVVIPGKKIRVTVVWKNNRFQARLDKDKLCEIDGWDDLSKSKWIYALPTNTYFTPWHKKLYIPPDKPDKAVLEMTLRFWGKFWHGMTLYGKLSDNVFYPNARHEYTVSTTDQGAEV